MTEPTLQQISEAQLRLITLARNVSDEGINHTSASTLLDAMDTRLVCILAARLINSLCHAQARYQVAVRRILLWR